MTADTRRDPRPYQVTAISSWEARQRQGILAMATGTGKTFTAINCIERTSRDVHGLSTVLITAPFQHLADQWAEELEAAGMRPIRAYEDSSRWRSEIRMGRRKASLRKQPLYILTTYTTLAREHFLAEVAPFATSTLLVADECHYLGSAGSQDFMSLPVAYRLGLSATPQRHFDDIGTQQLSEYFGGIVFEFGLPEAIQAGYLTPYNYLPEPVKLSEEEFNEYRQLTERIGRAMARNGSGDSKADELLHKLLIARARLLNNAEGKLGWLRHHLASKSMAELRYTLVYAGDRLFPEVTRLVGEELRIPSHAFTSAQSRSERASILQRFQTGELAVLVAMRCLDEGVDVPPTRSAYFLASSSNPREFVQRRGRILRTSPGKSIATIHDAIAVPPASSRAHRLDPAERAALRSQLSRIQEFGRQAENAVEADRALFRLRLLADLPAADPSPEGES